MSPVEPTVSDLAALLDAPGDGVAWSLRESEQLNANLVHLDPGHGIDPHVNHEVEVLIVVLGGGGELTIGEERHNLNRGVVAVVSRSLERAIRAGDHGLDYLTVHRRRGGLAITTNREDRRT